MLCSQLPIPTYTPNLPNTNMQKKPEMIDPIVWYGISNLLFYPVPSSVFHSFFLFSFNMHDV